MQGPTNGSEPEAFNLDLLKGTGVEGFQFHEANTPKLAHGTSTTSQLEPTLSEAFPWDGLGAELDCASAPLDFLAAQQVFPSMPFSRA